MPHPHTSMCLKYFHPAYVLAAHVSYIVELRASPCFVPQFLFLLLTSRFSLCELRSKVLLFKNPFPAIHSLYLHFSYIRSIRKCENLSDVVLLPQSLLLLLRPLYVCIHLFPRMSEIFINETYHMYVLCGYMCISR